MGGTKTAIITRKKTAAVVRDTATAKKETVAAVEIAATRETADAMGTAAMTKTAAAVKIVATATRAPKIFRKIAIIAAGEKTMTVAANAFERSAVTGFNRRKKYYLSDLYEKS